LDWWIHHFNGVKNSARGKLGYNHYFDTNRDYRHDTAKTAWRRYGVVGAMTLAMAVGPMFGLWVTQKMSYQALFLIAVGLTVVALLLTFAAKIPFRPNPGISKTGFFENPSYLSPYRLIKEGPFLTCKHAKPFTGFIHRLDSILESDTILLLT
jgi:MFS family permease